MTTEHNREAAGGEREPVDSPPPAPQDGQSQEGPRSAAEGNRKKRRRSRPLAEFDQFRDAIIRRQIRLSIDPDVKASDATGAFKAIVAAEKQLVENARADAGKKQNAARRRLARLVNELRRELLCNADYLDYLRLVATHRDPGPVRAVGQPGPVETRQAPDAP